MKDFARGYIASGVFNGCRARNTCKIRLLNCIVIQMSFNLCFRVLSIGSMEVQGVSFRLLLMKGIDILFSLAC